jgi:CIC family chloride channel protein
VNVNVPRSWRLNRERLRTSARNWHEVLLLAAIVGVLTGFGVAAFESVVSWGIDTLDAAPLWIAAVAPAVGLTVAALLLYFVGDKCGPSTADEYLRGFHDPNYQLQARQLVAKMAAGIATLAAGGPMGLEGPSLYLGSGLGDILARRLPRIFSVENRQTLLVAGAAAGVAAIFKAPATGAVFAIEVPYQEDLARHRLAPALVAAAAGYLAFVTVHGTDALLPVAGTPPFSFKDLAGAAALGLLAGGGARVFAWTLRRAKYLERRLPAWIRVPAAGATLAALFVITRALTGENLAIGPGYGTIRWALDPSQAVWLVGAVLLIRCIGTTVTVGGGGVGGLFIPLVVAGALAGRFVGGAVNALDTSLFVVIGVAAFLGAGYRVPLAAVMFVAEATGRPGFVVPGLIAAVVAGLVMGHSSVTAYQQTRERDDDFGVGAAQAGVPRPPT